MSQRSVYVYEKNFLHKSVSKICLYLSEIFFFYESVSKSSHWLYKFSLVPIDVMHMYLFSFYFLWWVKNWKKKKKIGVNFLGGGWKGVSQRIQTTLLSCSIFLYAYSWLHVTIKSNIYIYNILYIHDIRKYIHKYIIFF